MGARKGKMTVEFLSVNDLERIVGVIADGLSSEPQVAPRTVEAAEAAGMSEAEATSAASRATAAEALAQRRHVRFDDIGDLDLQAIQRAKDLSDLDG
jgi:hypothetical protein